MSTARLRRSRPTSVSAAAFALLAVALGTVLTGAHPAQQTGAHGHSIIGPVSATPALNTWGD